MSIKYDGPVVLVVMDGVGLSDKTEGNAVAQAHANTLHRLMRDFPMVRLGASGRYVGVPNDDMGNSEVGHNAIGAGQIIPQGPLRVQRAFDSGEAFATNSWKDAIRNVLDHNSTLHFMGIFSDGNVHSNINHLFAMMKEAQKEGVKRIRVHVALDGRDVSPESADKYITEFNDFVVSLGSPDYKIASGGGRMVVWADRYENDWGMVERGWRAAVLGEGRQFGSAEEAVAKLRLEEKPSSDQYISEFVIAENGTPIGTINDGDSVICINFRADRAIESAMAFTYNDFPYFDRVRRPDVHFVGVSEYNSDTHVPEHVLVPPLEINNTLSELLIKNQISEYAISETVKYGHITYYFDGNHYLQNSDSLRYEEVASEADTETIVTRPWMKSAEITDRIVETIKENKYKFIRINYPNGDMVGHFAEIEPTIVAMEAVDIALGRIIEAVDKVSGMCIITADHGNVEEIFDESGRPKTAHTNNPVPCIFYDTTENKNKYRISQGDFGLANIAASIATLLGVEPLEGWEQSIIITS